MPIEYNKKKKKWELNIPEGDKEELNAVLAVGKQVILGELTEDFTKRVYHHWLDMPLKKMFNA